MYYFLFVQTRSMAASETDKWSANTCSKQVLKKPENTRHADATTCHRQTHFVLRQPMVTFDSSLAEYKGRVCVLDKRHLAAKDIVLLFLKYISLTPNVKFIFFATVRCSCSRVITCFSVLHLKRQLNINQFRKYYVRTIITTYLSTSKNKGSFKAFLGKSSCK